MREETKLTADTPWRLALASVAGQHCARLVKSIFNIFECSLLAAPMDMRLCSLNLSIAALSGRARSADCDKGAVLPYVYTRRAQVVGDDHVNVAVQASTWMAKLWDHRLPSLAFARQQAHERVFLRFAKIPTPVVPGLTCFESAACAPPFSIASHILEVTGRTRRNNRGL